jgi:hypothetical protein
MFRITRQIMLIRASVPTVHILEIVEMPYLREPIPRYSMNKVLKCPRCDRTGHLPAYCIAKYDIGGHEIEDYDGVGTGTHA